jgi:hypothetical protein
MGFSFRKIIKLGPLHINLSKSGIGVSIGARPLRLSTGPRGSYAAVSGKGVSYRKRISGAISKVLRRLK